MRKERGIFPSGAGEAVCAQNLGRVVGGVEADAEQVRSAVACRISTDLAVDRGELMADARAEVGERAARIDEREQQGLATILMQRDTLTVLPFWLMSLKSGTRSPGFGICTVAVGVPAGAFECPVTLTFSSQYLSGSTTTSAVIESPGCS